MKKIMLIACCLIYATVTVNAQDKKMWLGGAAGYSSESSDNVDTKTSIGSFGPSFGYMLNENIAVGLGLSYSATKISDGTENEGALLYDTKNISELTFSPFVRYYKGLGDNLKIYGQISIDFGSGTTSWDGVVDANLDDVEVDDVKYSTLGVNVAPGLQYSLGQKWSINTAIGLLGYNIRTDKDLGTDLETGEPTDINTSTLDFGLDLSNIRIGIQYHF